MKLTTITVNLETNVVVVRESWGQLMEWDLEHGEVLPQWVNEQWASMKVDSIIGKRITWMA